MAWQDNANDSAGGYSPIVVANSTPIINSIGVNSTTGTMEDVFTFTLKVSSDTTKIRMFTEQGEVADEFDANGAYITSGPSNTSTWVIQRRIHMYGNRNLKWVAVNDKEQQSSSKDVYLVIKYMPQIYSVDVTPKSGNSGQEFKFNITVDAWTTGFKFITENGIVESHSISDSGVTVSPIDGQNNTKVITYRRVIQNAGERQISFRALNSSTPFSGVNEGNNSTVKFLVAIADSVPQDLKQFLDVARGEIGQTEDPIGSNKTKYGKWMKKDGVYWCSIFVSWVAHFSGNDNIIPKTASCYEGVQWFKAKGLFGTTPKKGAIVYFGVYGSQHVGIVESVNSDNTITTIEGNTSNGTGSEVVVARKTHKINSSWIYGYGYPQY